MYSILEYIRNLMILASHTKIYIKKNLFCIYNILKKLNA